MRVAMSEADVGDDRYGEDPTVNALEELYASIVGKEAALYLPSGTMANQVAVRTWTDPGDVIVAGRNQHLLQFERGGSAINSSVQVNGVDDVDGELVASDVAKEIELLRFLSHRVSLVAIENTHMPSGGTPWSLAALRSLRLAVGETPIHMDGARLFNASVATGVTPLEYAKEVDSVMSCVSKGLSAPVGSILAGTASFIERARNERGILGGQMRQAGILAAAGIVALTSMRERLVVDHVRAKLIGAAVVDRFGSESLDIERVRTNMIVFLVEDPTKVVAALREVGVLCGAVSPRHVRMVTHGDLSDDDVDLAAERIRSMSTPGR